MLAYTPVLVLGPGPRWARVAGLALALGAARLPDVDQRVPFVAHRGPTHTVWFGGVTALGGGVAVGTITSLSGVELPALVPLAILAGLGSHLVADALTPAGVRPLWPLWDRSFSLAVCRAENRFVNWTLFVGGLLAIALAVGEWGQVSIGVLG